MRFLAIAVPALLLLGCAQPPPGEAAAACRAQGHAPGSAEHRACIDAGGAAIATGPGSPAIKADEEEDGL